METKQIDGRLEVNSTQLSCLLAALNEIQLTIRAYDTKAQIMGVGFIFSVTMIGRLLENLDFEREFGLGFLIVGFILLLGPVALFGSVLSPTRRTSPVTLSGPSAVRHCLYFRSDGDRGLKDYLEDIESADWKSELAYEIIRLSALRDLKRARFLTAMFASGGSFAIILITNALKLSGAT
jgi:hypothetical protein